VGDGSVATLWLPVATIFDVCHMGSPVWIAFSDREMCHEVVVGGPMPVLLPAGVYTTSPDRIST
jgi:hypothetical protein